MGTPKKHLENKKHGVAREGNGGGNSLVESGQNNAEFGVEENPNMSAVLDALEKAFESDSRKESSVFPGVRCNENDIDAEDAFSKDVFCETSSEKETDKTEAASAKSELVEREMKHFAEKSNREINAFWRAARERRDVAGRYHLAEARTRGVLASATSPTIWEDVSVASSGPLWFIARTDVPPSEVPNTPTLVYDALIGKFDFISPLGAKARRESLLLKKNEIVEKKNWTEMARNSLKPEVSKKTGETKERKNNRNADEISPKDVKKYLDEFVVGQDSAKKALSVALCAHLSRNASGPSERDSLPRQNVLLAGPTGCGKTYMVKKCAEYAGVPFVCVDATQYTNSGFKGENVASIFRTLLDVSGGNVERAEKGIVYVDEADKLSSSFSSDSVLADSKNALQQEFLKATEGSVVNVPKNAAGTEFIRLDTSGILFIFGGCFTDVEKTVRNRLGKNARRTTGFLGEINGADKNFDFDFSRDASPDDIVGCGFSRELTGRFSVFAGVRPLREDDLVRILNESRESPLVQYGNLFRKRNALLDVSPDAVSRIAKKAFDAGTGARALHMLCARVFEDILFEASGGDDVFVDAPYAEAVLSGNAPRTSPFREKNIKAEPNRNESQRRRNSEKVA